MNTTDNKPKSNTASPKDIENKSRKDALKGGLIPERRESKPFCKTNFILMAVCLALIVLGFALMAGPGSSIEGGFNPDIFSTRRIIVGPLFAFLGFLFMAFAIIWRPGMLRRSMKQLREEDSNDAPANVFTLDNENNTTNGLD